MERFNGKYLENRKGQVLVIRTTDDRNVPVIAKTKVKGFTVYVGYSDDIDEIEAFCDTQVTRKGWMDSYLIYDESNF